MLKKVKLLQYFKNKTTFIFNPKAFGNENCKFGYFLSFLKKFFIFGILLKDIIDKVRNFSQKFVVKICLKTKYFDYEFNCYLKSTLK